MRKRKSGAAGRQSGDIGRQGRAEDLATAMEVRGYRGGEGRTKYRQLKWNMKDTVSLLVLVIVAVVLWMLRI